jgi:hypothetical protein
MECHHTCCNSYRIVISGLTVALATLLALLGIVSWALIQERRIAENELSTS